MKLTTKKQLMARYTILFAIISLIVFYPFYKNGVTFIWGAKGQDGLSQHINALMYWGEYIRNFFSNIIHGHFRFPMWDMSIGFGADILGTLNYYAIGDPLNLIYVFSNKSNIELLYNFMLVFRLYLAGVAFIAFGHYLKKDGKLGIADDEDEDEWEDDEEDAPEFKYEEKLPIGIDDHLNLYQYETFCYTNMKVILKEKNILKTENRRLVFY